MAEEIMKNQDDIFASRPSTKATKKLLYGNKNVGFAPYGKYWKQAKKIYIVHLLGASKVRSFELAREEEVRLAIEKIQCAERVVAKNISKKHLLRGLIEDGTALLGEFSFEDFFPGLGWLDFFLDFDSKIKKMAKNWDELLEEVIKAHMNTYHKSDKNERDFVDELLFLQSNGEAEFNITKDHIKGILIDMFGGGSHTTFITLEWVMAELAKDIKTMKKLQCEIRKMACEKEIIVEEDLKEMAYLKAVIKETLRLHTPAPLLVPRESMRESHIKGYMIPKGTKVLINAWAINRDPEIWNNSGKFIPERFLENNIDFRGNHFQFIPFGAGRRVCPGINFALSNIELILANILFHFDWDLPPGMERENLNMDDASGLSTRRSEKLYLVPKLRDDAS
ncbi:hypothetical protein LUZ60_015965 [Juncus effusus]|nr:hypothetical protein LUZ60_015965 [Juncus effusus]